MSLLEKPGSALLVSVAITVLILALWVVTAGVDPMGFTSYLLRFVHIYAAMLWIGLIYFVNFVQLAAVAEAAPENRSAIVKAIVPRVGSAVRHTSHLTVLSGLVLLISSGYLLDRMIFTTEVYIPPLRNLLLWGGVLGALAMWAFVQFFIAPSLKVVVGTSTGDEVAARARIKTFARLNLVLGLPVTAVMVAAAHLY